MLLRIRTTLAALTAAAFVMTAPVALADEASGNGQDPPNSTATGAACTVLSGAVSMDLATGTANLLLQVALL
jgi:hypothetical protein